MPEFLMHTDCSHAWERLVQKSAPSNTIDLSCSHRMEEAVRQALNFSDSFSLRFCLGYFGEDIS